MTFLCRSLVLGLCVQDPVDVLSRVNDDYFTGSWSEFFEFICRLLHGSEDPGVIFEELKPRKESFGEIDIPAATRRSTSPSSCSYTSLSVMAGGNGHRPQTTGPDHPRHCTANALWCHSATDPMGSITRQVGVY